MAIFRDESGRRGRAVRLAAVVGAFVALAAAGVFLISVFPARWSRTAHLGQPAPAGHKPSASGLSEQSRRAAYEKQAQKLDQLLAKAKAAQKKRHAADPLAPVLAGFVVNWDPESVRSLAAHADQLTHVMPEWIRVAPDGQFTLNQDPHVAQLAASLELLPVVQNLGDRGFDRSLALPILASAAQREDAAQRLLALCETNGFAGINLDFEQLNAKDFRDLAAFVEELSATLHPKGFLVTVDVPAETRTVPVERLAAAADFLVVMAYDEHAPLDNPGPVASPGFVAQAAAEYLRRAPADKLVLALGSYGYDWPLDEDGDTAKPAEELSYARALALARENEVPIDWDGQAKASSYEYDDDAAHQKHRVFFLDAPSLFAQLDSVSGLRLRGTALWRLGAEDPKLFDLFTKPPAQRAFDAAGARLRLNGEIAYAHQDVALVGDGELLRLKANPQPGQRRISWAPDGSLAQVEYTQYPSGWILERRGGKARGVVALSFDDGPDPTWTPQILDLLKARGVTATFFVIGQSAQARPELVRRELAEGHLIGNHSFTHPDLSQVSPLRLDLEINVDERLLEWITGVQPKLFRPPYHSDESLDEPWEAEVIARATEMGYDTLGHDIDPEDFSLRDPRVIADRVLAKAASGSVILLHDGGGDRAATLAAIPLILDGLAARGIRVVDVPTLFGLPKEYFLPQAPRAPAEALVQGADSLVFGTLGSIARFLGPAFAVAIALLGLRAALLALLAPIQARRARKQQWGPPNSAAAPPAVTVVVPAYNEESVIARTVETLLSQEPPVFEVVCVDDGSKDRTFAVLRERFEGHPRVRLFTKPNGGKASALNLGFAEARGEVVVALDSDTLFLPDTVAKLVAPFCDPRVGAVAGNAKVGNRINRLTRWQALEYVTAQNLERRAWDLAAAVPVVPGAVGAWRRSAVQELGGFHEDTLAEDTDLTLRLIASGWKVVYAEDALAYTEAPEQARPLLKQRFRWTYGVLQACWKHKTRLFRRGGGTLGWVILPTFALYQFLVPLVAPLVDLLLVVSLLRGQLGATVGYYLLFFALDLLLSAEAILLEGEDLGLLWGLFVQRVAYRQLLWLALVKSLWNAASGFTVGWGKLARTGSAQALPNKSGS